MKYINISQRLNSHIGIGAKQGQLIQNEILQNIGNNETSQLDFTGLNSTSTVFLKNIFTSLANVYEEDQLNQLISLHPSTSEILQNKIDLIIKSSDKLLDEAESEAKIYEYFG